MKPQNDPNGQEPLPFEGGESSDGIERPAPAAQNVHGGKLMRGFRNAAMSAMAFLGSAQALEAQPAKTPDKGGDKAKETTEQALEANAEQIGAKLTGAETKKAWPDIIKIITTPIPDFRKAPAELPAKELAEWNAKLAQERNDIAAVLLAVSKHPAGAPIPPEAADKVGRNIALYTDSLGRYCLALKQPNAPKVPDLFSKHLALSTRENIAHDVASRLLAMQYDLAERKDLNIPGSPRDYAAKTKEIALRAMQRRHIKVADALACADANTEEAYVAFLKKCDQMVPDEKDKKAAVIFTQYLKKNLKHLESAKGLAKKAPQDMSISEALQYLQPGDVTEFLKEVSDSVKKLEITDLISITRKIDLPALLEKTSEAKDLLSDETMKLLIISLMPELENEPPEEVSKDIQAVIAFMRGKTGDSTELRNIESNMGSLFAKQQKIVIAIKGEVMQAATTEKLLDSLFLSAKTKDPELREKARQAIDRRIVGGELTAHEALKLFLWLRSPMKNPLVIGSQTIGILGNHEEVELTHDLKLHQFDVIKDMVINDGSALEVELDNMGLSDDQKRELRNGVLYLKESGIKQYLSWQDQLWKTFKKYPFISTLILLLISSGTILTGVRVAKGVSRSYIRLQLRDLNMFAALTPEEVKKMAESYGIPVEQVEAAKAEVMKCLNELRAIQEGRLGISPTKATSSVTVPIPRTGINVPVARVPFVTRKAKQGYEKRLEARSIKAAFLSKSSLAELTKALKGRYGDWQIHELAEVMKPVANFDKEALRAAMVEAGYEPKAVEDGLSKVYFPAPEEMAEAEEAEPPAAPDAPEANA